MRTFFNRQSSTKAGATRRACWCATVIIAVGAAPSLAGSGVKAQAANARMGLRRSSLQRIALPDALGVDFSFDVELDGQVHLLHLTPYSMRSSRFRVRVDQGGGVLRDVDAPASATYRGVFDDGTGTVRASIDHDGLSAVLIHHQTEWYIEPNKTPRAANDRRRHRTHVVYARDNVLPDTGVCGHQGGSAIPAMIADRVDSPSVSSGVRIAEIAFDTDHEYYLALGSSVSAVVVDIERIMNAVDEVYDAQFGMRYEITDIIVREDPSDPYTTDQPGTLLQQFQFAWITPPESNIPRDLAHLFTGRAIKNNVIGFATLGSVCSTGQAFGLSRTRFSSNLARRVDLTTHEIGHNWNAPHCNTPTAPGLPFVGCCDAPTYTMCEFIGLSVRNTFCPPVIAFMSQFMDTRSCLDVPIATLTLPFSDDFSGDQIDETKWATNSATVDAVGDGEPSPSFSLRLNGADRLTSAFADSSSACGVTVEYWWQRTGTLGAGGSPEPGEDLTLEYRADSGLWEIAAQHPGDGPDDDPFEFASISLPPDASHGALQIRFSISGNPSLQDNFFVDDIVVRAQTTGVEIQTHPADQSVCAGTEVAFHVTATGDAPLSYQWMKDGLPLDGETGDSFVISSVGPSDSATYSVEVTNACGSALSDSAELTEISPITISTDPVGATLTPGESFFVFVTAGGSPTYQWFKNNIPIPGETGFSFRIPEVGCADAGSYRCELQNACSTESTETAQLTIDAVCLDETPPFIVHGDGLPGQTRPHSGYIDPRMESTDGVSHNLGITEITILFSEPVEDVGKPGGGLTPAAFTTRHSGGGDCPQVVDVDTSNMPLVIVTLCQRIPLGEWTTIQVAVQDLASVPNIIIDLGDQGVGIDEGDRLDLAALPCDVDQSGQVQPIDLLRFRQITNGVFAHAQGTVEDYVDMDRQGTVAPIDLLRFRQLFAGTGLSLNVWSGAELSTQRP